MTSPTLAHRELITKHNTLRSLSREASVSVRRTAGRFNVRVENFRTGLTTKKQFATLNGALTAYDAMREFYL